jgi:hypothetical protein
MSDEHPPRIGPDPAQFRRALGVGADDDRIHPVDQLGALLAAIQGIYQLAVEREAEVKQLRAEVEALKQAREKPPTRRP